MTIEEYRKFISKAEKLGALSELWDNVQLLNGIEDERMVVFSAQFIRDEQNIDNADGCWDLHCSNVGRLGMISKINIPKDITNHAEYKYIHEHYTDERYDDEDRRPAPLDLEVDWYTVDGIGKYPYSIEWWVSHTDITFVSDLTKEEMENFGITHKDIEIAKEFLIDRNY